MKKKGRERGNKGGQKRREGCKGEMQE